jgi:hypothetical protein
MMKIVQSKEYCGEKLLQNFPRIRAAHGNIWHSASAIYGHQTFTTACIRGSTQLQKLCCKVLVSTIVSLAPKPPGSITDPTATSSALEERRVSASHVVLQPCNIT